MSLATDYAEATDQETRRRLRAAVVAKYRCRVAAYVRRTTPERHWREGTQIALIGLLRGLQKWPAGRRDDGEEFWFFAFGYIRSELQSWTEAGAYGWQRPTRSQPAD